MPLSNAQHREMAISVDAPEAFASVVNHLRKSCALEYGELVENNNKTWLIVNCSEELPESWKIADSSSSTQYTRRYGKQRLENLQHLYSSIRLDDDRLKSLKLEEQLPTRSIPTKPLNISQKEEDEDRLPHQFSTQYFF